MNTNYGPLTLMEGWVSFQSNDFENVVLQLVGNFLTIHFIIDELLAANKK